MALLLCFRNRHQDQSDSDSRHHVSLHFSLDCRPHTWKKSISDSCYTQMLPKILPVTRIFSFTIMTYLKKSDSDSRHHVSLHFSLDCRPHTWKKSISDSCYTQMLPKILPVTRIFSFTIMTYLKKLIGIKSLNTKQCPARTITSPPVSPKMYHHSYQKRAKVSGFD